MKMTGPPIGVEDDACGGVIELNDEKNDPAKHKTFMLGAWTPPSRMPTTPIACTQEAVYKHCGERLFQPFLDGYHVAMFAYGQTGTGKTTTCMGDKTQRSPSRDCCSELWMTFSSSSKTMSSLLPFTAPFSRSTTSTSTTCSNRVILVSPQPAGGAPAPKLGVYVPNCTDEPIKDCDAGIKLIDFANTMKTVHATQMNSQSSRGHTVFHLKLERHVSDMETKTSGLYLVDLAGRENERTTLVTGERLVELSFINKSLFHLSNCIHALGDMAAKKPRKSVAGGEARKSVAGGDAPAARKSVAARKSTKGPRPACSEIRNSRCSSRTRFQETPRQRSARRCRLRWRTMRKTCARCVSRRP